MCNCCPKKTNNSRPCEAYLDSLSQQPALYPGPTFLLASCATCSRDVLAATERAERRSGHARLQWQGEGHCWLRWPKDCCRATGPRRKRNRWVTARVSVCMFDGNVRVRQRGVGIRVPWRACVRACSCRLVGVAWSCGLLRGVTQTTGMISSSHDS